MMPHSAVGRNWLVAGGVCWCVCPMLLCRREPRSFLGWGNALCHSLSWRRGELWLRFQWGVTVFASWLCHGVGSALPPVPPGSAAWPLDAWNTRDPSSTSFGGVGVDKWGSSGWEGDGWDPTGCPSNILHRTPALCSKGFSARDVLTEFSWLPISVRYLLLKKKTKPTSCLVSK